MSVVNSGRNKKLGMDNDKENRRNLEFFVRKKRGKERVYERSKDR